jgi:hypothetical protein
MYYNYVYFCSAFWFSLTGLAYHYHFILQYLDALFSLKYHSSYFAGRPSMHFDLFCLIKILPFLSLCPLMVFRILMKRDSDILLGLHTIDEKEEQFLQHFSVCWIYVKLGFDTGSGWTWTR